MADKKISQLPASTTPLAGTEVLPIVQSSTTKQVSVANLTAGRDVSALSLTSTNDAVINTVRVGRGGTNPHSSNTCVGAGALAAQSGGFGATAVGNGALAALTTGQQIVAVGSGALATSTTGKQSVAIGHNALNVTTGSNETAIGYQAGAVSTNGGVGFAGGSNALSGLTTGSAIGIGVNAGNNLTTGTSGIYIGTNSQPAAVSSTNEIVIGTGTTGGGSNTTTLGTSTTTNTIIPAGNATITNGNLVIGTSGKGIDFSAVVHSGSTSKLLADYEVGTWTPTLKDSGNNACTLTTANGKYIKVGNQVTIWFQIVSSTNLTDANYYQLQSLPFAPPSGTFATGTAYSPTASVGRSCTYRIDTDTTAMYIRIFYANGAATNLSFANSVSGTVTYYV